MNEPRPSLLPIALTLLEGAAWALLITGFLSRDPVLFVVGAVIMVGNFLAMARQLRREFPFPRKHGLKKRWS